MTSRRIEEVRQLLVTSRLQGLLVTFLPNIRYLTGFTGTSAVFLLRMDEAFLITDPRYRDQVSTEVSGVRTIIPRGNFPDAIVQRRLVSRKDRIGFEAMSLPFSTHAKLKKTFRNCTLVPTVSVVEQVRIRKDEREIEALKHAARITDKVFGKIITILKPGMREQEVAAEISYWNRSFGAEGNAFDPIVVSGIRGALPHGRATAKLLKRGEMVTIDMGCRVGGYRSDLTRTVSLGRARGELKSIYRIVREAQEKALAAAAPTVKARALDAIARKHIRRMGYGKLFPHALGHGLGLEIHERPLVSAKGTELLQESTVITIEPGIYVPGVGGVRIEDDIVLRQTGNEVLTHSPKQLIEL
ncbi:MAG TPA: Xaa-Pro peptidase family protein [Bacteroidota bacterium]|nr:Xaa-Pro peptidase family protein [Bacteroidota bacterium]